LVATNVNKCHQISYDVTLTVIISILHHWWWH